jgi:hypothetical protein
LRDPKLQKLDGDALDQHTIERALAGANAVIQTLGVSPTPEMIFGGTRLFSVVALRRLAAEKPASGAVVVPAAQPGSPADSASDPSDGSAEG